MRQSVIRLLVVGLCTSAAANTNDDLAWMRTMLSGWQEIAQNDLRLEGQVMPWVVFFGREKVWHVRPDEELLRGTMGEPLSKAVLETRDLRMNVLGFSHEGMVWHPGGDPIPAQLILFASTYGDADKSYFVFAMPEIWRSTPRHAQEEDLDALIRAVFIHEITHTQQANTLGRRVDELAAKHGLDSEEINDDMIQDRFGSRPGMEEIFDAERNLYFEAALAPSESECRDLTKRAMDATRARRDAWYRGEDAAYAEFEDLFLIFEGSANWAAYRALVRSGMTKNEALPTLRRGGKWWSQDQGLAIFLVLERVRSAWRETAFSADPASILTMLEEGLESDRS